MIRGKGRGDGKWEVRGWVPLSADQLSSMMKWIRRRWLASRRSACSEIPCMGGKGEREVRKGWGGEDRDDMLIS